MKIAIMQPYFAPYMGYFQLVNAVDKFVFLDDVNFIKGGWINRNQITLNGSLHRFSIPLKEQSSFKKINEIEVDWDSRMMGKVQKTFQQRFGKNSPARKIVEEIFSSRPERICDMAIMSINKLSAYLGISTTFSLSSSYHIDRTEDRAQFLVDICNTEGARTYINPAGGQELYNKSEFKAHGIDLYFLDGQPGSSLLDTIDLESKESVSKALNNFRLI